MSKIAILLAFFLSLPVNTARTSFENNVPEPDANIGSRRGIDSILTGERSDGFGWIFDRRLVSGRVNSSESAVQKYLDLPLRFEPNKGQISSNRVKYITRSLGQQVYLGSTDAWFDLECPRGDLKEDGSRPYKAPINCESVSVNMHLEGAKRESKVTPLGLQKGKSSFFKGNDPAKWVSAVPGYDSVMFHNVYDGIDIKYHSSEKKLEYDFIVKPGADPSAIKLRFSGQERLRLSENGDLVIDTSIGQLVHRKPHVYQEENGVRTLVDGGYSVKHDELMFKIGDYDHSKTLIIDPIVIAFSTWIGGNSFDYGYDIAVDSEGNVYIAGETASTNFFALKQSSDYDAFVIKLNSSGNFFEYKVNIGGSGDDVARSLAVDESGSAYITGRTDGGFPMVSPIQGTKPQFYSYVPFITKLDPVGHTIAFSTYHYDPNQNGVAEDAAGISVDPSGNVYVCGTGSGLGVGPFISKLNAAGNQIIYRTFSGGTPYGVVANSTGEAYVTGETGSTGSATPGTFQPSLAGTGTDAFVRKYDANGGLVFSTFLGGTEADRGYDIAVDDSGAITVVGETLSDNFPQAKASQPVHAGNRDGFVTQMNPSASNLFFSTYIGGSSTDRAYGVALGPNEEIYVTGSTGSPDLPIANARQPIYQGSVDTFLAGYFPNGDLWFSTFHGGDSNDNGRSISLDAAGNIYTGGFSLGGTFPIVNAVQPNHASPGGTDDSFISKFSSLDFYSWVQGRLTLANNSPIAAVPVKATGGTSNERLTNPDGNYQINLFRSDSYTIKPDMHNFVWSPSQHQIEFTFSNAVFDKNFVGTLINDNLSAAIPLTGSAGKTNGNNTGATSELNEPLHANQQGGKSVWYRWTAPSSGRFRFTTLLSNFNTLLAVYQGAAIASLTPVVSNNDESAPTLRTSMVDFTAVAGTQYRIAIDGFQGATGNFNIEFIEITNKLVGYTRNINGQGVSNILLSVQCSGFSGSGTSGANGFYQIPISASVPTASCTIEPDTVGSGFSLWNSDPTGRNFTGLFPSYTVSGRLDGLPLSAANNTSSPVILSGPSIVPGPCIPGVSIDNSVTPAVGKYSCTGLSHFGNYTISPTNTGYKFRGFNNLSHYNYPKIAGSQLNQTFVAEPLKSISGTVLDAQGRGLRNANVFLVDPQGVRRSVPTSSLGFYLIEGVPGGVVYTIGVVSRRYRFESRNISVDSNLTNVDFVGLE